MKKMKLRTKLLAGFLLVGSMVVAVGFVGWNGMKTSEKTAQKVNYAEGIAQQLLQREIDHLLWAEKVGRFQQDETVTRLGVEKDDHQCGFGKWYYSEDRKNAEMAIPGIKDPLKEIEAPHAKLHRSAQLLEEMLKKGNAFRGEAGAFFRTETNDQLVRVRDALGKIRKTIETKVQETQKSAETQRDRTELVMWIVAAFSAVFAILFGTLLSLSITRPVQRVADALTEGADQLASASKQVSSSSQSLAAGTSEQAAAIEETSSSLEEVSSITRQNEDHAAEAKGMIEEARRIVSKVEGHMNEMAAAVLEITRSSEETGKIIKSIDEIAFQTNLLALNAAVEAARAGTAGAGFAVVADEVRNLAIRASEAAGNTADLIEKTIKAVRNGGQLTRSTQEAFRENIEIVEKVGRLVDEIVAASHEQTQGIAQVNTAVSEIDQVIQQSAANSEQSAAAAEQMSAQAETIKKIVQNLMDLVGGRNDAGNHEKDTIKPVEDSPRSLSRATPMHASQGGRKPSGSGMLLPLSSLKVASHEDAIPLDRAIAQDF